MGTECGLEKNVFTDPSDALESGDLKQEKNGFPDVIGSLKSSLHHAAASSFLQATVNSSVLLIGLGTLSSAYAIEKCGLFGILVLLMTVLFYWFGCKLLCKCMDVDKSLMNYQDIATKAFPGWGRLVIRAFFYIRILGTLVGYMVSIGDTIIHLFPHSHLAIMSVNQKTIFTCIAFLVILPTVWVRKLSTISYLSFWSAISILITILCLLVAAVKNQIGFNKKVAFFNIENLPIATGLYTFTFGSTSVLPSVYGSMAAPTRFAEVAAISFSLAVTLNVVVGVMGSTMFGAMTKPQVHLNMPRELMASKIAIGATLLVPIAQFALMLSPISCEMEDLMLNKVLPQKTSPRMANAACLLMRATVLVAITIGALVFPYFVNTIQLIGSSMSVTIGIIFPCLFYYKLFYNKLDKWQIAGLSAMIAVSASVGVVGTIYSIEDLMNK